MSSENVLARIDRYASINIMQKHYKQRINIIIIIRICVLKSVSCNICRCLEEGAEDFLVKPVKLADVKRLKNYVFGEDKQISEKGGINKRKLEEICEVDSSTLLSSSFCPPPQSSSTLSSPPCSPSLLTSPTRRLKMTNREVELEQDDNIVNMFSSFLGFGQLL